MSPIPRSAAKRRAHRDHGELKEQRGDEPVEILPRLAGRGAVGREAFGVFVSKGEEDDAEDETGGAREDQRLIEHALGLVPVLPAEGLGDERGGSDTEGLGESEDEEHHGPREAHTGDRLLTELTDEIEVGEEVKGLKRGGNRDEAGEPGHVAGNRPLGHVLHGVGTLHQGFGGLPLPPRNLRTAVTVIRDKANSIA